MTIATLPGDAAAGPESALARWQRELQDWKIPDAILAQAPEPPWALPQRALLARARERIAGAFTPSDELAAQALPADGTVLDVGSGPGAASLPFAHRARRLLAVDANTRLLALFAQLAEDACASYDILEGTWPDCAPRIPVTDIVVCHHVLYNVADLRPFVQALAEHARLRVVVELSQRHPLSWTAPLWRHFHDIDRPQGPTAADALLAIRELGFDAQQRDWERVVATQTGEELVATARRHLCLHPRHDAEIGRILAAQGWADRDGSPQLPPQHIVTIWWHGLGEAHGRVPGRPGHA